MNSGLSTDHGLFLSHLRQHRGSSLCGHLAVVGSICSLLPFRYSFKTKTNQAQTKMKALPDSSLYDPYQALSSSYPSLQASFTSIAICKGINSGGNFFKIIFCGNFLYCNYWWFESHISGINLLFGVLIVMWFGFAIVTYPIGCWICNVVK